MGFNTPIADKVIPDPAATGDRVTLAGDGQYRWRVGARDRAGNKAPTGDLEVRTFTIAVPACVFPKEVVKTGWNLVGWACDQPGDPQQIATELGGLVRFLEWDAGSQSFTRSFSSDRPFNTLTQLVKWQGYWLFHQP